MSDKIEVSFTIDTDDIVDSFLISKVADAIDISAIAEEIGIEDVAEHLDVDNIADLVAEHFDNDDIIISVTDRLRDDHYQEFDEAVACNLAEYLANDNGSFRYAVKNMLANIVDDKITELVKIINSQDEAIIRLTKEVDAMQTKKFWKKIKKG